MPSHRIKKILRPYKPLHSSFCQESEKDFHYMQDLLQIDRRSIVRFQDTKDNPTFKCPPLMAAYCVKHYKCMKFLLDNGAKPEGMNLNKYTTMHFALHDDDYTAVTLLLDYGIDTNFNESGCGSFLSWSLGNEKITRLLLNHGAKTDTVSEEHEEAYYTSNLSKALRKGHCECAKLLLLFDAVTDYRKIPRVHPTTLYLNAFPHCVIKSSRPMKSIETQMRMFAMLHQFGIDLYQRNRIGITVLDVLRFQSIGDEESRILAEYLKQLLSQPLSLMSLSRIVIKQMLGRETINKLAILEKLHILPVPLIRFLHFPDV